MAVVRDEPGCDIAVARLPGSFMSAVNASEAFMRGVEKGVPIGLMRDLLNSQGVNIRPFDEDLALRAALLRPATKRAGLSFADRACIATAVRLGATAVTADRSWATLDLPCTIELIR